MQSFRLASGLLSSGSSGTCSFGHERGRIEESLFPLSLVQRIPGDLNLREVPLPHGSIELGEMREISV